MHINNLCMKVNTGISKLMQKLNGNDYTLRFVKN